MTGSTSEAPATGPCQLADVATYLDGELDAVAGVSFEQHMKVCVACAAALSEQRSLLCVLDVAFGGAPEKLELPQNFSKVVTARAQTDMSRMRQRVERQRAFMLCAALAALSLATLGLRALNEALSPVRLVWRAILTALDVIGHAIVETFAGMSLILRALGNRLAAEPSAFGVLTFTILAAVLALLLQQIANYHRTRLPD